MKKSQDTWHWSFPTRCAGRGRMLDAKQVRIGRETVLDCVRRRRVLEEVDNG